VRRRGPPARGRAEHSTPCAVNIRSFSRGYGAFSLSTPAYKPLKTKDSRHRRAKVKDLRPVEPLGRDTAAARRGRGPVANERSGDRNRQPGLGMRRRPPHDHHGSPRRRPGRAPLARRRTAIERAEGIPVTGSALRPIAICSLRQADPAAPGLPSGQACRSPR
jgi:hypothetical protein